MPPARPPRARDGRSRMPEACGWRRCQGCVQCGRRAAGRQHRIFQAEIRLRQEVQHHGRIEGVQAHRHRERLQRLGRPTGIHQRQSGRGIALSKVGIERHHAATPPARLPGRAATATRRPAPGGSPAPDRSIRRRGAPIFASSSACAGSGAQPLTYSEIAASANPACGRAKFRSISIARRYITRACATNSRVPQSQQFARAQPGLRTPPRCRYRVGAAAAPRPASG